MKQHILKPVRVVVVAYQKKFRYERCPGPEICEKYILSQKIYKQTSLSQFVYFLREVCKSVFTPSPWLIRLLDLGKIRVNQKQVI